jgi:hypothetical protein
MKILELPAIIAAEMLALSAVVAVIGGIAERFFGV